ncbi:MAG: hypothetical protein EOL97_09735 [Spirochaetia bacterium]|nr:hypothetical protein [Spirochaetia bacterium]
MKIFNNLKEMEQYYNSKTNTYEFVENENLLDVKFNFNLNIESDIRTHNITAYDIKAWNIYADDINAYDIKAWNIDACNINAYDIDAENIEYYAVCFAYNTLKCKSIKGIRENAKHFCLDNEIEFKGETK